MRDNQRARGLGGRARRRDRRSARDGQPAVLQPERPRAVRRRRAYRNRAATDLFEPGSSIKPFIVAAALASGQYRANSIDRHRRRLLQVGVEAHPGRARPRRDRPGHGAGQVVQRRHGEDRAVARPKTQLHDTLRRARLRPGDRERLPRRVGRAAVELLRTGARSASRRWPMATACRSRRCSSRRPTRRSAPRHAPPGHASAASTRPPPGERVVDPARSRAS